MSRFRSMAVLVALGIVWGLTFPLTKIAVSTGHRALGLVFWQLVILAFTLAAISAVRRVGPSVNRKTLLYFLVIAMLGAIIPNGFSYLAIAHLPAGVYGIIIASVPIFALGIALVLRSERPTIQRAIGVLLGAGAVILLMGPKTSLPDPDSAVFVLLALVAPFCYGAEGNYIATRTPADVDPVATLLGASALGCVIVGPLVIFTDSWVDLFKPWESPEWALLLSSLLHVIAYTGYIWLVGMTGAVFASQVSYVVTVSAVLLSSLILGETYSAWVWSALALMFAGLTLVQPNPITKKVMDTHQFEKP